MYYNIIGKYLNSIFAREKRYSYNVQRIGGEHVR